ncbi:MAG: PDZ domain-containing protein, partial [Planctomycetota bacterium]
MIRSIVSLIALALLSAAPALAGGFLGVWLNKDAPGGQGALIEEVAPESPAAAAGLRPGDYVVSVNGRATGDSAAFIGHLERAQSGQTLTLEIQRDGWGKRVEVKLGARPGSERAPKSDVPPATPNQPRGFLGIMLRRPSAQESRPVIDGVQPGSPAATGGLKNGDVLTRIGEVQIEDTGDLMQALAQYGPGDRVRIEVERGGRGARVEVTLGNPVIEEETPAPRATPSTPPVYAPADKQPPYLGVALDDSSGSLKVVELSANSPAESSGLRSGDE